MKTYRAAIVGIGGFGTQHVNVLLELAKEGLVEVSAFAELNTDTYRDSYERLTAIGAKHFADYENMLAEHPETDFVVIATPIAAHKPMCIRILELGFHVLVEKPPAVTIQDVDAMIAAQQASGRLCQVNFQNTSGRAFRELLGQLREGAVGKVTHVTGVGMWKRTRAYYDRNRWAGKLMHNGQYVLDGTFNNPLAHLLNNCLLAAGAASGTGSSAQPEWVQAELYHVNDIEGDDVSCIRAGMPDGATVSFYAMLCHEGTEVPYIAIRGTEGDMLWTYENKLTVKTLGGIEESHTFGSDPLMRNMYMNLMQVIGDPAAKLYSPIDACRSFVLAANGAYESSRTVRTIAETYYTERTEGNTSVRLLPGLSEAMKDTAARGLLFSEYPLPWAVPTNRVKMDAYGRFELFRGAGLNG